MAIDEALLEHCTCPALRFYGWRGPSLSFGYFGKFADIAREAKDRELVRRWTGGGSVPHGQDLTYSLVTPASDPASGRGPPLIYAALHSAIREALAGGWAGDRTGHGSRAENLRRLFRQSGARRSNLPRPQNRRGGPAPNARRLSPSRQHSVARSSKAFRDRFASALSKKVEHEEIPPQVVERAAELAVEKYGTEDGCVVGRMPSSSFDFKSRPSILRL